ncbi:isochorismate synthase [Vibrio ostreicida]|uniref:isochorismate synthase n=1 Tax=Vibrio ostreicida TaxID=526588 RepID=UPI003B5A6DFF
MLNFDQAVTELIARVKTAEVGAHREVESVALCPDFTYIDWMDSQPLFPKFYWQSRDAGEEVVALGHMATFTESELASTIVSGDQRIWGGRPFDSDNETSSFFFLPLIELIRCEKHVVLAVNISADKQRTVKALQTLVGHAGGLAPMSGQIKSLRHVPDRTHWSRLVDKALADIDNDQLDKVVLARKTYVELDTPVSAAQLLKASYVNNQNSFHFMLVLNPRCSFLGSTPERLYACEGQDLLTEALAGTAGRGQGTNEDMALAHWLCHDHKNLDENQYVVDDIIQRLRPYSDQVDVEQEVSLVRLRQVQHLKRHIRARLKPGIKALPLLTALQPTAAVAGLPRDAAMDFIRKNEPFSRGWYAGSMGYVREQSAQFCVAIRSALVLENQIHLFAGAGIVPGSEANSEWQELDKKLSTLLSLMVDLPRLGVAS